MPPDIAAQLIHQRAQTIGILIESIELDLSNIRRAVRTQDWPATEAELNLKTHDLHKVRDFARALVAEYGPEGEFRR